MAAPADVEVRGSTRPDAEVDELRQQVNNLTASFRLLTAKMDVMGAKLNADAGVTDADYAVDFDSTITASGVATAPAEVNRIYG